MPRSRAKETRRQKARNSMAGRGQITRGGVTSGRGIAKALNARGVATGKGRNMDGCPGPFDHGAARPLK
jgi:hypothetical protein